MDCIPEKILGLKIASSGEVHVPLSNTEACAILDNGITLCGSLTDILNGDIYNCPTIDDPRSQITIDPSNYIYFYLYLGDYVIPRRNIPMTYSVDYSAFHPKWLTLQLPLPYDFVVIGSGHVENSASYISDTIDLRFLPLRYIYLAPGATLRSVEIEFDKKDVPNYVKKFWNRIKSKPIVHHAFNPTFHKFGPTGIGSVSWKIPSIKELQPISELINPRFYCDPDQRTFSINYIISGGTRRSIIPGYAYSYYCMLGDIKLAGDTFSCETDTPLSPGAILYVDYGDLDRSSFRYSPPIFHVLEDGELQEIGGIYSVRTNAQAQDVPQYGIVDGGLFCCPTVTPYPGGQRYCSKFCPGNQVGPEALPNQATDSYIDLVRPPVPLSFDPEGIENIVCYSDDFCRHYYISGYIGGSCQFTEAQIQSQIVQMRIYGEFVNIPYSVILGGCHYPVTILNNISKYYCNVEGINGDVTYTIGGTPFVSGRTRLAYFSPIPSNHEIYVQ